KGENAVKIFGPELGRLEELAGKVKEALAGVRGVENPGGFRIQGQASLEFPIDREKCARWNVRVADVNDVIQTAVGGKAGTQMIEGEKPSGLILRWPARLRGDEQAILDIPVEVTNRVVTGGSAAVLGATPTTGASTGPAATGTSTAGPALTGSAVNAPA